MTKDTNEKNTQSSGFRDQILRDLEELKVKRLAEQSADVLVDKRNEVINELQPSLAEEKAPHRETEIVKVEGIAFPDSYLSEEQQESEVMTESIEEPTSETLATPETFVIEKEVVSSPVPQDTVERNLEKLRNLVAANTAGFDEVPSSSSVSEPVESVLPGNSPLEDTFLEFPTEDVSAVTGDTEIISLEETIIAPKTTAIVPEVDKQMQETQPRRRTTHRTSKQRRKKQDNAAKHIVSVIMSIVVVAVLVTGVTGYMWVKSSLEPVDAKATETIQVEIPEGTSTLEIGKILVDNKLIKNATIFN
ncbi:TPA: aminodeoxychorismate lyase, partial [Streptococcus suis]|nr:aminodeoxychorismate lyase [Streptococcus suis]